MNFDRYTIKSQEALQKSGAVASELEQQAIEPGHLLKGIMQTDESITSFLIKKLNINQTVMNDKLEEILKGYPKVAGQQPYLSNDSAAALQKAEKYLKEFGDEYIALEHILLGIRDGKEKAAQGGGSERA